MQMDLLCPVENQGVIVKTNSKTGEPYALFKLFNLSEQVIEKVVFTVRAFDAYGNELGAVPAEFCEVNGQPKSFFAANKAVSLKDFPEAKHITADFSEVYFAEGEPYVKNGELTEIAVIEPDYDEKVRLLSAAGEDAECYAKDMGTYWLCVCGRPNVNEAEACVRCGREKTEVMELYSSRDALSKTIAELEEKQRQEEEEKRLAEEQAKAEKIAKRKKVALFTAIGAVSLAVLITVIYFVYGAVMTAMGNSAAKKGDFLSAYSRYVAADNSGKIAEVSEEVRGNSNTNLLMLGLLTSDEENIYYIDPMFALHKENKATGEKTKLGDASGALLNVMDGWLYYVDTNTGQGINRISTDGEVTEVVYASTESYLAALTVVGNEIYFIMQEPIKDLTPAMQEQIAAGQMSPNQNRLYRMEIGKKKPELVMDREITDLFYYKDRLYYIEGADGAVYSMNRHGGEVTKVVNGPVYGFEIHNDTLYYLDGTPDEETGIPTLTLTHVSLDGTYLEDIVSGKLTVAFGFDGDDLYYLVQEENGSLNLYKKDGSEEILVAEGCRQFNVYDGYIVYLDEMGRFMKSTHDKSGFEEVPFELPVMPEETITETTPAPAAE